jgi:hypothetical protein
MARKNYCYTGKKNATPPCAGHGAGGIIDPRLSCPPHTADLFRLTAANGSAIGHCSLSGFSPGSADYGLLANVAWLGQVLSRIGRLPAACK